MAEGEGLELCRGDSALDCQTSAISPIDGHTEFSGSSNATLTAERVRELLNYDPATGVFRWRKRVGCRGAAGAIAGCPRFGHIAIGIDHVQYWAHRLAFLYMTRSWPKGDVSWRNGDGADNRWNNLRVASRGETAIARALSSKNTSGVKGVSWDARSDKWLSFITVNGRRMNLGRYSGFDEAVAVRRTAEQKYFPGFSSTP